MVHAEEEEEDAYLQVAELVELFEEVHLVVQVGVGFIKDEARV